VRTIVITGATRGIGRALALRLAGPDVRLVLTGRSTRERPDKRLPGTLEEVAEIASDRGAEVHGVVADLSVLDQVEGLARFVVDELGGADVLVNNAAISYLGRFVDVAAQRWWSTVALDLLAPAHLMHAVLPGMIERREGLVLNVGSAAAYEDAVPQLPYSVSKIGLERLTTGVAAQEQHEGVAVALVRIDELVVTEAVHLSAPHLVTDSSTEVDTFAVAMQWLISNPSGLHGRVLTFDDLRALGALPA
jgi:NAD(P)-dependent dehydrogenase (short-subunit alcohol dehydrogenase family)